MFHIDPTLMRSILTSFVTAALCSLSLTAAAQSGRQAIIANGGVFTAGNIATVASYDLNNGAYRVFDSVGARSVQDVLISGNAAYVAADSMILRYDIDTYTREAAVVAPGVRKLALWGNRLVATMGFGANFDYVRTYDATTLNQLSAISGLSGECEGISIWGDTAIVAVPIGFGAASGKIAVIDLAANVLRTEIDLDSNGRGIKELYPANGKVWALSPISYLNPYSYLTEFDPTSLAYTQHRVDMEAMGSVGVHAGVYYVRRNAGVYSFDLTNASVLDSLLFPAHGYAGGVVNTQTGEFLLTETDYFSFGKAYRYAAAGSLLDSLAVGISPEALAIDYRLPLGVSAPAAQPLGLWPNPATDAVSFQLDKPLRNAQLRVVDALGREVLVRDYAQVQAARLPVEALPAGLYHVVLRSSSQQYVGRFLK